MTLTYPKTTVLDHGYLQLKDVMGSDERIVEAARMSTGKGFLGWGPKHAEECPSTVDPLHAKVIPRARGMAPILVHGGACECEPKAGDEKLLAFLWNNRHTTPFEQCCLSIEVQAPLMVFREWHRHRTQSYNEFSARYAQMPNLHYLPSADRVRGQSVINKQATGDDALPPLIVAEFLRRCDEEQQLVYRNYEWAIENGIAREVARLDTPVSRYSRMVASGNLLNWLRFVGLRNAPTAQWEIRQYAVVLNDILKERFPRTLALFEEKPL